MSKLHAVFFTAPCLLIALSLGCRHEVEVKPIEVKPMHITIDVNVKIQEDLKSKFEAQDKLAKETSDKEAEEALKKYLEGKEGK